MKWNYYYDDDSINSLSFTLKWFLLIKSFFLLIFVYVCTRKESETWEKNVKMGDGSIDVVYLIKRYWTHKNSSCAIIIFSIIIMLLYHHLYRKRLWCDIIYFIFNFFYLPTYNYYQ